MVTPERKDYFILSLLKYRFGDDRYVEWDLSICVAAPVTEGRIVSVEEIFMRYGIDAFIEISLNGSFVKPKQEDVPCSASTDCRSEEGVTVGLIDGIIAICRVLRHQEMSDPAVVGALADLRDDEDLAWLLSE